MAQELIMDPNATLLRIDAFLTAGKSGECVDEWVSDLWNWIDQGGFQPDWDRWMLGTSYYQTMTGRGKHDVDV